MSHRYQEPSPPSTYAGENWGLGGMGNQLQPESLIQLNFALHPKPLSQTPKVLRVMQRFARAK